MSRVGDKIKDGRGVEWAIARIWKWPKWDDLDLINVETGERGSLREKVEEDSDE